MRADPVSNTKPYYDHAHAVNLITTTIDRQTDVYYTIDLAQVVECQRVTSTNRHFPNCRQKYTQWTPLSEVAKVITGTQRIKKVNRQFVREQAAERGRPGRVGLRAESAQARC